MCSSIILHGEMCTRRHEIWLSGKGIGPPRSDDYRSYADLDVYQSKNYMLQSLHHLMDGSARAPTKVVPSGDTRGVGARNLRSHDSLMGLPP